MSQLISKPLVVTALVLLCGFAAAQPPGGTGAPPAPPDSIKFTGPPTPGANKGEIAAAVSWEGNQIGIGKVEIKLYEVVNGQEKVVTSISSGATISPGTFTNTFKNLTFQKVITRAYTRTIDVSGNTISEAELKNLSVTVP